MAKMTILSLITLMGLRILTLYIYILIGFLIEALIQFISSRIQNTRFSNIFYWTMFAASRFAFITIDWCFVFEILDEVNSGIWRGYILLSAMFGWVVSGTIMNTTISDRLEKLRRERLSKNDCPNWKHPGLLYFKQQHQHLPLFDPIKFIYTFYRQHKRNASLPYKWTIAPVTMLESYHSDPLFPECSMIHSIVLFVCDKCTKDNGFYWIRSSNLRRQGHVRYLGPFEGAVNGTWYNAIYQREFILINVADSESQKCYSYDIRNGHFSIEFIIKPRSGRFCWILLDDGKELGQQRRSSSAYFRAMYQSGQGVGHYGQCLLEISEDKRIKNRHFVQLVPYQWPWQLHDHKAFITSTGQVGMQVKLRDASSNGEVSWKTCVIYDPKSFMLKAIRDMEDLMETDRPLRLYAQRYLENNDTDDLPHPSILNEQEALVCRTNGSIWRTRFQPPSLKSTCLEKVFKGYGKALNKLSAKDWLQMTGVDMWPNFPSQK